MEFLNKKVAVLGFGLEGRDLARFLLNKGAAITVFDEKDTPELSFEGIDRKKLTLICGKKYLSKGFNNFDVVFRSPGVYRFLPELLKAEKNGVEVSSATKLFFDLCPSRIIGVTGTKGKGTVATLIYRILKEAGKDVFLTGNIGKPYIELLPKLKKKSLVVMELSSFQLIDITKSPHIAVVLNITVDHLDWHKNKKEYLEAKINILKFQNRNNYAVINADYVSSRSFKKYTKAKIYYFSKSKKLKGSYIKKGKIILSVKSREEVIGNTKELMLKGKHNWENVCSAVCASYLAGGDISFIKKAVFSFRGLEHRLELVGKVDERSFYNDSFATSPLPTIAAIKSFDEPSTLILGGFDKKLNYSKLGKEIAKRRNINTIILIGETAGLIKTSLETGGFSGRIINLGRSKMGKIVKVAFKNTPNGGVILLSPAAASFDMFANYKERGEHFKKAIEDLR